MRLGLVLLFLCSLARAESTIAYLTDTEGSWKKFTSFFENHDCFFTGADGKVHLKPDAHFVFGGDAADRGPGSIRIVEELLRLKQESGERVTFIVGNRDINKLRLRAELSPAALNGRPAAEQLKEKFAKTMGSVKGFEFRREELALLEKKPLAEVADEKVVESFLKELGPGGNFERFLEQGQLTHRIGNTLFVHSGVTEDALGYVPGKTKVPAADWPAELNAWYQREFQKWKATRDQWDGNGPRPGEPLISYPIPEKGQIQTPRSVLYGRTADAMNNLHLPPSSVIQALRAMGIERLVIGHTPTGQVPHILRGEGIELVNPDNSYAKNEDIAPRVTIKGKKGEILAIETTYVHSDGQLEKIHFSTELGHETPIGKRLADGSLVLAPVKEGYLTFKWMGIGKPEIQRLPMEEVARRGYASPCAQISALAI